MPPRWPKPPTRQDPDYRKMDDRVTLATHVMLFATGSSGLTFVKLVRQAEWPWYAPVVLSWLSLLVIHALWVLVIARYPGSESSSSSAANGSSGGSS
ncbi:MAG: hypothetical protein AAFY57_05455 [Cyanobacteria bacterium J06642_2]